MKLSLRSTRSFFSKLFGYYGSKGIVLREETFIKSADLAMNGVYIYDIHGINGKTPELTMKHMGLIASPGMVGTEKTIVEIFENKLRE